MAENLTQTRRRFLVGIASGGTAITGSIRGSNAFGEDNKKKEEEISPAEDLMREHGVLRRILLIYREAIRRIEAKQAIPPESIAGAAHLVRSFVEDYHEKMEEEQVFPRFKKANTLVSLTDTLYQQHQKGRILTQTVLKLAAPASIKNPAELSNLKEALSLFVRMYEPHAAREDTVLFPAFRQIVSGREYDQLGDQFEKKEHELFGEEGFEKKVEEVGNIEKALGIYDLAQFTPKV